MLENGGAQLDARASSSRLSKRRRNCRKNGGARSWAAACDELHVSASEQELPGDEDESLPGRPVWAKSEGGLWWPAFVNPHVEPSNITEKRFAAIDVKFFGRIDVPFGKDVHCMPLRDIELYSGNPEKFSKQFTSESPEAAKFQAAVNELQQVYGKFFSGVVEPEMMTPESASDAFRIDETPPPEKQSSKKRKNIQDSPDAEQENPLRKLNVKLRFSSQEGPAPEKPKKQLGPDGWYSECMLCDGGGNLICCDNCPCVYHLHCLSPPLKRAPAGKWLCPTCKETGIAESNSETEKSQKRNGDEMIKRFKKKPKCDDEAATSDKFLQCGLNKQSSETFLDNGSPLGFLHDEDEMNSLAAVKNLPVCEYCGEHGSLLKCDRCAMAFHPTCLETPLKKMPKGRWTCAACSATDSKKRKADQISLPAASSEVDRIVGCRMQPVSNKETAAKTSDSTINGSGTAAVAGQETETKQADGETPGDETKTGGDHAEPGLEFLVKWVGRSHVHNEWIPEARLKTLAKRKLENYKGKHGVVTKNLVEERWTQPQRIISRRKSQDGADEVLVKWTALPYDECTWERFDGVSASSELAGLLSTFELFEREAGPGSAGSSNGSEGRHERGGELEMLKEQPPELQGGSLFPHQMEALNWLRRCWHKKKNVILADEMGLGKTISACSFLSSLHHEFKVKGPCLVLVPLSTMPNWLAEFSLWAPGLNVIEYHGSVKARAIIRHYEWHPAGGSRKQRVYKFKVMLTNYETVINDPGPLKSLPWEVLVVDEGHRLKNSGSKLFTLLNTFSFRHRVLMTGTPMQNNLGEMYNLLNFLLPEKFPSLAAFQEKFSALSTAQQVEEIRNLVAPHMLRRLKKDAMQGIPPKAERVVLVELSSVQAEYYRALLTKNFQLLRQGTKSQQSMINIIMQLRKVCNHPYLIPGTEPDSSNVDFLHEMRIKASAKLTLLHSMLRQLKEQGHRVLIFSQMTKLLDILEDYLNFEFGAESYERVDGSVPVGERQAAIRRFNKDKSRFVFLLSTRSCGLGINLATADTVIIYDSDFNPHADIQAMNRAHRIGQSKKLLVYRLVVRGSVEERILHLAKKKLELEQLFASKSGSQKEIEDILQWGTEDLFEAAPAEKLGAEEVHAQATEGINGKAKRKVGGLGDVYNDKCHEAGRAKIVWDDAAIKRLLDRAAIAPEAGENDGEGDMLGSIKAWEHEQEPEEQNPEPQTLRDEPKAEAEGDNKWERLLRIRWEKLQTEEEAVLGRGKRLRKVISYSECAVQKAKDVSSESEEVENPEPEYSPAGHALKLKLAKLRARQKERIALRYKPVLQPEIPVRVFQTSLSELKHAGFPFRGEFPVDFRPHELPSHLLPATTTSEAKRSEHPFPLPEPVDEALMQKALASRLSKMADDVPESSRAPQVDLNLFPGGMPPSLPDGVKPGPTSLRNMVPGFEKKGPFLSQGLPVNFENPSRSFLHGPFAFQSHSSSVNKVEHVEHEKPLPRHHDLSSSSSLKKAEESRSLAAVDLNRDAELGVPPFDGGKFTRLSTPPERLAKLIPPGLSMSLTLGNLVAGELERYNVMDRKLEPMSFKAPGSRAAKPDPWTDDELDALWVGVRRHGRGNWLVMLQDYRLCFSKRRTAVELAQRWEEEQARLLGEPEPRRENLLANGKPKRDRSRHRKEAKSKAPPSFGLKDAPPGSKLLPNFADFNFPPGTAPRGELDLGGRFKFSDRPELSSQLSSVLQKLQDAPGGSHPLPPLPSFNLDPKHLNSAVAAAAAAAALPPKAGKSSGALPHWLKEAFNVAPCPEPALSPHVAAVAQAVSILHKNQKPLLVPWSQSWHPPVPPRELSIRRRRRKRRAHHHRPRNEALEQRLMTPTLGESSSAAAVVHPGTRLPSVHLPPFTSFSRSLLDPLTLSSVPPPLMLPSDNATLPIPTQAPFLPELFPPPFRSKYLDGQIQRGSAGKPDVLQLQPSLPQQQMNFGSLKHSKDKMKTELPPWLAPPAPINSKPAAVSKPPPPPPAAETGDSSSETHSDPDVRNNKGEDEVDVSSEGTVSDEEVQKL